MRSKPKKNRKSRLPRWRRVGYAGMAELALRKLGKPVHYVEMIAKMREMFPDWPTMPPLKFIDRQYRKPMSGIVSLGKGVYALAEWKLSRSRHPFDSTESPLWIQNYRLVYMHRARAR